MVIRVEAAEDPNGQALVDELVDMFGSECVSREHGEVHLRPDRDSNRALVQTLDAVAGWLSDSRIDSTAVWVDDRFYRLDRRRPLTVKT